MRLPDSGPAALMNGSPKFRRTLARVMTVQIVTLLLLWMLQARYTA